jgi:hypothetical protein
MYTSNDILIRKILNLKEVKWEINEITKLKTYF